METRVTDCDYCGEIALCREDGAGGKGCRSCLTSHSKGSTMCVCVYCDLPIVDVAAVVLGGSPLHPACAEECMDELHGDERDENEYDDMFADDMETEYDGQPSEYEEWQDYYGGDDWDHGQYDQYE